MSKIARASCAMLLLILSFLLIFTFALPQKYAKADDGQNDYIIAYLSSNNDGSMIYGVEYGVDYANIDNTEAMIFKGRLKNLAQERLNEYKNSITEKYNQNKLSLKEEYLPEQIEFKNITDKDFDYYGFEIKFNSYQTFEYYLNFTQRETDEGLFISTTTQRAKTQDLSQIITDIMAEIKTVASHLTFENFVQKYNPICYIDIETFNARVKSDASQILRDQYDQYHHIWQLNQGNLDKDVTIKLKIIHTQWWYFFALIVPIAVMFGTIAILSLYKISKKKD